MHSYDSIYLPGASALYHFQYAQRFLAVGSWRYNSIFVPGIQWRGVRMRVKVMVRARGEDESEGHGESEG